MGGLPWEDGQDRQTGLGSIFWNGRSSNCSKGTDCAKFSHMCVNCTDHCTYIYDTPNEYGDVQRHGTRMCRIVHVTLLVSTSRTCILWMSCMSLLFTRISRASENCKPFPMPDNVRTCGHPRYALDRCPWIYPCGHYSALPQWMSNSLIYSDLEDMWVPPTC